MSKVTFERVHGVAILNGIVDGYRLGAWVAHRAVGGKGWAATHVESGATRAAGSFVEAKRIALAMHTEAHALPGAGWEIAPAVEPVAPVAVAPVFDVVAFAERLVEAGVASTKMATMLVSTFTFGAAGRKGRVIAPAGNLDAAIARALGNLGEATKRARAVAEARVAFGLTA